MHTDASCGSRSACGLLDAWLGLGHIKVLATCQECRQPTVCLHLWSMQHDAARKCLSTSEIVQVLSLDGEDIHDKSLNCQLLFFTMSWHEQYPYTSLTMEKDLPKP